ncbi:MAG: MarR family winged helix-turn-helix transcriptional regulator [Pirellulaceae bacterium]
MNAGHDIAMALRGAYWAMHRQADARLQPGGVSANQFVLLSLLHEQEGVTQRELVTRAASDPNTVRAMLVALERKGLIERNHHPTDGRAWCVTLSAEGRRTYQRLWSQSRAFRTRLAAAFQPAEIESLLDLLDRLTTAMDATGPGATRSARLPST